MFLRNFKIKVIKPNFHCDKFLTNVLIEIISMVPAHGHRHSCTLLLLFLDRSVFFCLLPLSGSVSSPHRLVCGNVNGYTAGSELIRAQAVSSMTKMAVGVVVGLEET